MLLLFLEDHKVIPFPTLLNRIADCVDLEPPVELLVKSFATNKMKPRRAPPPDQSYCRIFSKWLQFCDVQIFVISASFLRITFVSSICCSGMHRRLVHQERQGYIPPIIVVQSMLPLPWSWLFMMFTCLTWVKTWWWGKCFLAICSEYLLRPTIDTVDVKSNHSVYVGCLRFTRSSWILCFNLANVELHLFKWGESFQSPVHFPAPLMIVETVSATRNMKRRARSGNFLAL